MQGQFFIPHTLFRIKVFLDFLVKLLQPSKNVLCRKITCDKECKKLWLSLDCQILDPSGFTLQGVFWGVNADVLWKEFRELFIIWIILVYIEHTFLNLCETELEVIQLFCEVGFAFDENAYVAHPGFLLLDFVLLERIVSIRFCLFIYVDTIV